MITTYHKILIISPGLIFVQKAFFVDLFSGSLEEILHFNNKLKQLTLTAHGLCIQEATAYYWKDIYV